MALKSTHWTLYLQIIIYINGQEAIKPGRDFLMYMRSNNSVFKYKVHGSTASLKLPVIRLGLDRTEAWTTPGQTKRIRRQYSGTKWCGLGNDASHYEDLGTKKELDMCCRDHDHCPVSVNGRTYNATLKLVNISKIPRSSCECEEKFYKCVKNAQKYTSDAALIGFVYFNILKMECIAQTHPKKCTQYFLWIFCIRWEEDRTIQTYRYISSYLRY